MEEAVFDGNVIGTGSGAEGEDPRVRVCLGADVRPRFTGSPQINPARRGNIDQRWRDLEADPQTLRANALSHWWPQRPKPS